MPGLAQAETGYSATIEAAVAELERQLQGSYKLSRRAIALLLLQGDAEIEASAQEAEGDRFGAIASTVDRTRASYSQPLSYVVARHYQQAARHLIERAVTTGPARRQRLSHVLGRATMHPVLGWPILLAVVYLGLYQFVGVFGAGTLVDFLEVRVFEAGINPFVERLAAALIPWEVLRDLFVGEYGVITLGVRYAVAIIFPIVGTFFLAFSVIEDSGYLPRLALLIDRLLKAIGLNGRAVIPMVLGFGCDTMATIVTRTQETRRERVITTLLLALAIPCSAQLGVIFAILSGSPAALAIWAGVVGLVLLLVGLLASRVLPGERASFYMEVPPLRLPKLSNVLAKTYTRMQWYFVEILPIFLLASVAIWVGQITGLFGLLIRGLEPLVGAIGLPPQTAEVFLFGFFRRDFGAAGLYDLHSAGVLAGIPLVVAAVTLTLFVPCIAQFSVMMKERGLRTALAMGAFIFPFAFLAGFLTKIALTALGVSL